VIRKLRKQKNVIPTVERRNPDLHGHIYKPLDRRQQGDERLLRRLCNSEFRNSDDYEMNDLPCSDYERGYMD